MDVSNTSALVTGAASGLGAATAAALADRGVRVIGVDLPAGIEKAPEVDGITYHAADVTQPDDVRAAVAMASSLSRP